MSDCIQLRIHSRQHGQIRLFLVRQRAHILFLKLRQLGILIVQLPLCVFHLLCEKIRGLGILLVNVAGVLLHEHRRDFRANSLRCLRIVRRHVYVKTGQLPVGHSLHRLQRRYFDRCPQLCNQILHMDLVSQGWIQSKLFDDWLQPRTAQNLVFERGEAIRLIRAG